MIIITFCDNVLDENYTRLAKEISRQEFKLINLYNGKNPFSGFFNRWNDISLYIKTNTNPNDDIVVIDGLDVFVIGDLNKIKNEISLDSVLYGNHSPVQGHFLKNTCNKSIGILAGKSKNILDISECCVNAKQSERDFFYDCDQSYFNFIINENIKLNHISFVRSKFIYMNSDDVDLNTSVFYHAVGMNDFYGTKTKSNLKKLGIDFHPTFKLKRYFSYIKKWAKIELKLLFY